MNARAWCLYLFLNQFSASTNTPLLLASVGLVKREEALADTAVSVAENKDEALAAQLECIQWYSGDIARHCDEVDHDAMKGSEKNKRNTTETG